MPRVGIMLIPVVCVKALAAFYAHLTDMLSHNNVGITLLVSMQGCGKPQIADEQMLMPTFS